MNYEKDMRIDASALDVEWLDQAPLAMKYGRNFAEYKRDLTNAQERIKVVRSELIKEANEDPVGCCDKEKPNSNDIEAYYRNHNRHKEIKKEIVELQYELDMAEIAKNEISFTRKIALENLVRLHGQQYFAGPSVPRDLSKEWEQREKQKRGDIRVRKRMKRTK